MIQFNRKPLPAWYQIVEGSLEIIDGVLRLISLGYISSQLSFHFTCWHSMREMHKRILEEQTHA